MIRKSPLCSAIVITLLAVAPAEAERYGWTVSASAASPYVSTATPAAGLLELYVWYACNADSGLYAAEMDIAVSGGLQFAGVVPQNGFLNAGSGLQLLLPIAGCPDAARVAAVITLWDDGSGGAVCLVPSSFLGNISIPCADGGPSQTETEPNAIRGFASDGSVPCETGTSCFPPISVDGTSWGRLKALYAD